MLISWNWLREYVQVDDSPENVGGRLMAAGLNLESVESIGDDVVLDLEVTSNRPDCLGHIGVAREVAALYGVPLQIPEVGAAADVSATGDASVSVTIEDPKACPRYVARVIRGVKIGPSPAWMVDRLAAVGQKSVNNVVDATNYALLELGQPFHAFDATRVGGDAIHVRWARNGETIVALNQKDGQEEYKLSDSNLVIADAEKPLALAGIMGGLKSGVTSSTTDVILETADFPALAIRGTARQFSLFSPSQFRFERGVDRDQIDWASRRCAELIVSVAGGTLVDGVTDSYPVRRESGDGITLRFGEIERILGVAIPASQVVDILARLGLEVLSQSDAEARFEAPTWRQDLTREIDFIEEVARVVGYDAIPDDAVVPLSLSRRSSLDTARDRVRDVFTANGFCETLTMSFVSDGDLALFDPVRDREALAVEHSSRRHENRLRKSLIPSLLHCRRENERKGSYSADLFEIAKVYLEAAPGEPEAKVEPIRISFVTGRPFFEAKGIVEQIVSRINPALQLSVRAADHEDLAAGRSAELLLGDVSLGWMGQLAPQIQQSRELELRDEVIVAEIDFSMLLAEMSNVRTHTPVSVYPAIERDLNFVLAEEVTWGRLEEIVQSVGGDQLEDVRFVNQFRGKQLGANLKSYVARTVFRDAERTLSSDEVDTMVSTIVKRCEQELGATLRA